MLTIDADDIEGGEGDDTFNAPIDTNELGVEINTLQSADVLDGGEGVNTLNAVFIPGSTFAAISPETDNIQIVNIQVQFPARDAPVNSSTLDAGDMSGVEQWWSDESRSGLQIEDIRSETDETAFGMRETDPGVGYSAAFNANYINDDSETSIVLDGAGAGGQGGIMSVGGMGFDGIPVFNVFVDGSSHLTGLWSFAAQDGITNVNAALEVVNIESIGAMGDLTIGVSPVGAPDERVVNGLQDVREVNAGDFEGMLNVGITLANNSNFLDSYFDAGETDFIYTGGDGGNIFTINATGIPAIQGDPDFSMEVTGGAADDRFNLANIGRKDSVTIDGEGGSNTVELTTSTSAANNGNDVFEGFDNIQTLVVAGSGGTTQDVLNGNMLGLEDIVVATSGGDTTIVNLEADTDVAVSGKNQTAAPGTSNNDQSFGDIVIEDAQGDAVNVALENTARADGHLQVGSLEFDGGATSSVTIDSGATSERDQTNSIQSFEGAGVSGIDVTGTQDLAMGLAGYPTQSPYEAKVAAGSSIDFDASALSGDVALALDAALLSSGDSFVGSDAPDSNDMIAFSGDLAEREFDANAEANLPVENDDELTLGSSLTVDGVTGVNAAAPTITNIENVWFGTDSGTDLDVGAFANDTGVNTFGNAASGLFSAANVSGQDAFILGNLDGDFYLTDLSSNIVVDADGFTDQDIWLSAEDPSGSALDLEMVGRDSSVSSDGDTFTFSYGTDYGGAKIHINDFDDVNLATGYYGDDGTAGEFDDESEVTYDNIVLNDDLEAAYDDPDGDFDDEIATDRDSVTLNIDNSVVGDGTHTINNLNVVRTTELNITAVGAATFVFGDIAAAGTTDVNLSAEGDLTASFSDLLSNGTPPNAGEFVTLDASGVDGDADITMASGVLKRGATDTLMGSASGNDRLVFEGDLDGLATSVSGFETIAFGTDTDGAEGTVNAANFSGVDMYSIDELEDALTINNLGSVANVEIGAGASGENITLNSGSSDTINVTFNDVEESETDAYASDLTIGNYETINLQMGVNEGKDVSYAFDLFLDDDARTLNITGGDADGDDSLTLGVDLNTSLTSVDVSDYDGGFTGAWGGQAGSNATIRVGDEDFDFNVLGSFGNTALFRASQLGEDDDYDENGEITLTVNGQIDGFTVPNGATYTYQVEASGEDDRDQALEDMAADLSQVTDTVTLGSNDYTVSYNASFSGGAFSVEFVATDEDGNEVSTSVDDFSFEKDGGGGGTAISQIQVTDPDDADAFDADAFSNFVSTFRFTEEASEDATWVIDNFQGFNEDHVGLDNASVIDLRDFNLDSFSEVDIEGGTWNAGSEEFTIGAGDDVVVTADGFDFQIVLTGIETGDLSNENFNI